MPFALKKDSKVVCCCTVNKHQHNWYGTQARMTMRVMLTSSTVSVARHITELTCLSCLRGVDLHDAGKISLVTGPQQHVRMFVAVAGRVTLV